jgi:hypothetical protein
MNRRTGNDMGSELRGEYIVCVTGCSQNFFRELTDHKEAETTRTDRYRVLVRTSGQVVVTKHVSSLALSHTIARHTKAVLVQSIER